MKRPEIVDTLRKALKKVAPDATAILYGSEARGDARPDSDIDLLILMDKERISLEDEMRIIDPIYEIELQSGIQINPFFQTVKKWGERLLHNMIEGVKTHEGVHQMLGKHFINTGILSKEMGKFYTVLFARRSAADYDDFLNYDRQAVLELQPRAEVFVMTIRSLINK